MKFLSARTHAHRIPCIGENRMLKPFPIVPQFHVRGFSSQNSSIASIAQHITEKNCKNIIVLTGAGISVSSGIPDFRSPGTGLYYNLQKFNLPHPMTIFELEYFKTNPKPFYTVAKELFPGNFKPSPVHYFIKLLHKKGNYTQNIDCLERQAGLPSEALVEAHGSFNTAHCLSCKKEYPFQNLKAIILRKHDLQSQFLKEKVHNDEIPHCPHCKGLVKPDIVFFGEQLPERFHQLYPQVRCPGFLFLSEKDFAKCDALIVSGTSLQVHPVASLVHEVPSSCPLLFINKERIGNGLSSKHRLVVNYEGDCNEGIYNFADELGWTKDLDKLVNGK